MRAKRGQEEIGAPPLPSTEQLGQLRLASCGTLTPSPGHRKEGNSPSPGLVQCAFLGGGKEDQDDYYILEDVDTQMEASLSPGLLQDRLLVLQAKAVEAIQALPAHCREDHAFGLVETRVWGLEALKHILRMRLAMQGSVQLTRPVTELQEWANEANGQCLGKDVQHIVFHVGRYYHCAKAKAWIKHHNRLGIPSAFQCPQMTTTGHVGQGTFVLRGVIAHQGAELISGHYVTLLVEGDALWSVDDDQVPQAQTTIPEIFRSGAVMIWASKAEHSQFWTRTIGTFEPPAKRPRLIGEGIEVFYSNVTQWNNAAKEWMLQTEHHTVALVETHLHGQKAAHGKQSFWKRMKLVEEVQVEARCFVAGKGNLPIGCIILTMQAMVFWPMCCNDRSLRLSWSVCT